MQYSCYIEINLLCLILLAIMYARLRQNRSIVSVSQKLMGLLISATGLMCLCDVAAMVCRGQFFPGARFVIYASNTLYVIMMSAIASIWYAFTCARLGSPLSQRQFWLLQIPLALFVLIALTNPWTKILFSVNEENLYSRGPALFLHWIVSWGYFLCAGYKTLHTIQKTPSWVLRNQYRPLLNFLILPAIGCFTQMMFYGITSVQAGITISIVMILLQMQDSQISVDELTGLNNRTAMRQYLDTQMRRSPVPELSVFIVDINKFKHINDTLGHVVGDAALRDAAEILRTVCGKSQTPLFLCRYGGDEFIIISQDVQQKELAEQIRREVAEVSGAMHKPYTLSVSVGCAVGVCGSFEEFRELLHKADEGMYANKHNR